MRTISAYDTRYSTFLVHEVQLTFAKSVFQQCLCTPYSWKVLYYNVCKRADDLYEYYYSPEKSVLQSFSLTRLILEMEDDLRKLRLSVLGQLDQFLVTLSHL